MSIDIKVPALPESIADATIATWNVEPGAAVQEGDILVELETDKVVLEVPAPADGVLTDRLHGEGDTVVADDILGKLEAGAVSTKPVQDIPEASAASTALANSAQATAVSTVDLSADTSLSPAVRRLITEYNLNPSQISGTGKNGKITKQDVEGFMTKQASGASSSSAQAQSSVSVDQAGDRAEKRVPLSRMRARIAERLLDVSQSTAMLTTFNEVDMAPVKNLRAKYKDQFLKTHGVKLGFMSFFTAAVVAALKKFPAINASLDGNDVVYHGFCDVGIAVSTDKGLVVPVLRNVENMSMADIEKGLVDYAGKAREGKISLEDMTGGTFTITNGGVFGSLLSTPILNSPQSAILGMHKIEDRPVVVDGEIVIRPMMYLAMSYDHRIVDGKESVSFLATVKSLLEDPARLLLEI